MSKPIRPNFVATDMTPGKVKDEKFWPGKNVYIYSFLKTSILITIFLQPDVINLWLIDLTEIEISKFYDFRLQRNKRWINQSKAVSRLRGLAGKTNLCKGDGGAVL